jgi:hypothetical protein
MSSHTKTKKKLKNLSASGQHHKRFVLYDYGLLQTEAFKYLTGGAFKLLTVLRMRFNGINNGFISMSVREAATSINVSKETIAKYFNELINKGFVKLKQKGSFGFKKRHASTWILTMEEDQQGNKPRTFKHWKKDQS